MKETKGAISGSITNTIQKKASVNQLVNIKYKSL